MTEPVFVAEAIDSTTGTLRERGPDRGNRDDAEGDLESLREKWALATTFRVREIG
jgi:hypothetical protein